MTADVNALALDGQDQDARRNHDSCPTYHSGPSAEMEEGRLQGIRVLDAA